MELLLEGVKGHNRTKECVNMHYLIVILALATLCLAASFRCQPAGLHVKSRVDAPSWGLSGTWRRTRLQGSGLDSGEPLELCEENAVLVVEEMRKELGTIFGYDPKSREVGITGEIEFVECDGPSFSVSLSGRFWHATDTVMMRVESYVKNRIPEVMEVTLDMSKSNIQDDNRLNTDGGKRLF